MTFGKETSMKRIQILAGLLCLCMIFSGCSFHDLPWDSQNQYQQTQTVSESSSQTQEDLKIEQKIDYENLPDDDCRTLYDQLLPGVSEIPTQQQSDGTYPIQEVTIPLSLSAAQIQESVRAMRNDHPEYFWLSTVYQYRYFGGNTSVQLFSYLSPEESAQNSQQLKQVIEGILANIDENSNDLDREIAAFNALSDRCAYDFDAEKDESKWRAYTAIGALLDGKAVCDGYARAMELLCSYVKIPCRIIYGTSKGDSHAWNLIDLDGNWYHFDPTWIDSSSIRVYDAFNVTDKVIQLDHTISPINGEEDGNFEMPACTATEDNYFVARGVPINRTDGLGSEEIIKALKEAMISGNTNLAFYIDPSINFQTELKALFSGFPYQFEKWVEAANSSLPSEKQIHYNSVRYIPFEAMHGISLQLDYQES